MQRIMHIRTGIMLWILGVLVVPLQVHAQFSNDPVRSTITKVGTTAAQFLKLGVGARALGLGGAYVAEANDLSAIYWNPAGLALLSGSEVQFSYTQYLADIQYNFAAFATNLGMWGTLGAAIYYMDSGEMPVRTVYHPEGTGERFKAQSLALQLSYGRSLTDRFIIGFSFKYIREAIWHASASSVALDIGVRFITPYERLRLGASVSNFGPKMQMRGRDIWFSVDPDPQNEGNVEVVNAQYLMDWWPLPLLFRVGVAWDAILTSDHRLMLMTDAAHPNDNSEYVNVGAEYTFRRLVSLRVGYKNAFERDGEQGLTFGGGINLRVAGPLRMKVDYAYASFGRLESTNWFSVSLVF